MKKTLYPLSEVYRLLVSGPVVLLTTVFADRINIITLAWYTMMKFEPPIIGCIVSENNYSFNFLKTTKECVINIPTLNIAEKVIGCGNTSGRTIDKFKTFQLTPITASVVTAPLIEECYANLECKVIDMKMVSQYNFFILEVVNAWLDPAEKQPKTIHHLGNEVFMVAGKIIQLSPNMK
jgi:flavin reductase (DIM6/NTAB) family NADH-FMN oxidoreductase RutF